MTSLWKKLFNYMILTNNKVNQESEFVLCALNIYKNRKINCIYFKKIKVQQIK